MRTDGRGVGGSSPSGFVSAVTIAGWSIELEPEGRWRRPVGHDGYDRRGRHRCRVPGCRRHRSRRPRRRRYRAGASPTRPIRSGRLVGRWPPSIAATATEEARCGRATQGRHPMSTGAVSHPVWGRGCNLVMGVEEVDDERRRLRVEAIMQIERSVATVSWNSSMLTSRAVRWRSRSAWAMTPCLRSTGDPVVWLARRVHCQTSWSGHDR